VGTVRHRQSKKASVLWSQRIRGFGEDALYKLTFYITLHHEETRELPGETQETMPDARRRGRPRTAWMDNIKTWTGLPVEESVRMTEDRDKWRKYVRGVANPRIEDG